MAIEPTKVGIVLTRIDGQKVVVRCYEGPDDSSATAAYGACLAMRDALEFMRADKIHGANIGPSLPYRASTIPV